MEQFKLIPAAKKWQRLRSYMFINRTLARDADLEKKVEALMSDQITAALRKHIDPSRISIIKAGNFTKAAKSGSN